MKNHRFGHVGFFYKNKQKRIELVTRPAISVESCEHAPIEANWCVNNGWLGRHLQVVEGLASAGFDVSCSKNLPRESCGQLLIVKYGHWRILITKAFSQGTYSSTKNTTRQRVLPPGKSDRTERSYYFALQHRFIICWHNKHREGESNKYILDLPGGEINDPISFVPSCNSLILGLRHLKCFLSRHGALQGFSTSPCKLLSELLTKKDTDYLGALCAEVPGHHQV